MSRKSFQTSIIVLVAFLVIANFSQYNSSFNFEPKKTTIENLLPSTLSQNNYTMISEIDNNLETLNTHDITIIDDIAFLASGPEGLNIINISDPNSPKLIK